jgi:hypothetical protein
VFEPVRLRDRTTTERGIEVGERDDPWGGRRLRLVGVDVAVEAVADHPGAAGRVAEEGGRPGQDQQPLLAPVVQW